MNTPRLSYKLRLTGISMDCRLRSQMGGRAAGRIVRKYVVTATTPDPTHTGVEMLLMYWMTVSRLGKPRLHRKSILQMMLEECGHPRRTFTVFDYRKDYV